ncbi:MAG: LPS assembly lipoprotein LptE [Planctomycetota bacterium]|jgi:outer membrane lipopolysaccharide assembly protein LptE/RlpB
MTRALSTGLLLVLTACGYTMGFAGKTGIRTIAIEVVRNETFRQRIERPLTRELYRDLNIYTDYRLAPQATADAVLTVTLVDVRNRTLVTGSAAPVEEGSLAVVADVRLLDRRSGDVVVDRRIRDIAEYRVPLGENQETAGTELVSDLSRKIMLALEGDF